MIDRNSNHIVTHGFSNPASEHLYKTVWREEPEAQAKYRSGWDCVGCNFFAALNSDWGVCCYKRSRHYTETVFEHFTCRSHVNKPDGEGSTFSDYHLYRNL